MDYDLDHVDDDLLYDCPCQFCERVFPFLFLIEHQYQCDENPANTLNLAFNEFEDELQNAEATNEEENAVSLSLIPHRPESPPEDILINSNISAPVALEVVENASKITPKECKKELSPAEVLKDDTPVVKKELFPDGVWEDEIPLDGKTTFTFGSTKSEKLEEEKPSFKAPPNPILNIDSKQLFNNNLTESDDEEGESLEDFWKRADIKLSQRLRMIQNKMQDRLI